MKEEKERLAAQGRMCVWDGGVQPAQGGGQEWALSSEKWPDHRALFSQRV